MPAAGGPAAEVDRDTEHGVGRREHTDDQPSARTGRSATILPISPQHAGGSPGKVRASSSAPPARVVRTSGVGGEVPARRAPTTDTVIITAVKATRVATT